MLSYSALFGFDSVSSSRVVHAINDVTVVISCVANIKAIYVLTKISNTSILETCQGKTPHTYIDKKRKSALTDVFVRLEQMVSKLIVKKLNNYFGKVIMHGKYCTIIQQYKV